MSAVSAVMRGRRAWDGFWFAEVSPYPLAAFRILYGIYLLAYFLRFSLRVELMFSNRGVYIPFLIPDVAPGPALAVAIYAATLGAIVLFILGWRTRIVTPLVLAGFTYHWLLALAVHDTSFNRLNVIFLAICCLARLDAAWAVRPSSPPLVSAFAQRLLGLQLALLYFGSGLWKITMSDWHTGRTLEHHFIGPWGTPLSYWIARLQLHPAVFDVLAWSTIAFELTAPFALYSRRLRKFVFVFGVLFHLSNSLILYIPEFLHCVTLYVLFMDADVVRNTGEAIAGALWPGRRGRSRFA